MREWLVKVNGTNPQFRPVCGFQPVYEADAGKMNILLSEAVQADHFDMLYASDQVEVYAMHILRRTDPIRFHDVRYIASLVGYEEWLVSAGLIAVNRDSQLNPQLRRAKRDLARAINDIWGIDVRIKKTSA